ncbi:magnesium/cobalt transporter CorA [Candidatus Peregrinibacteria bacterium]|nr:magnesium/cobalt transporter CorA [Candidatus Peregrinibacteria bacterium]
MYENLIKYKGIEWTDIAVPDKETVEKLYAKYNFHELDLEDCLQGNQRSKIDEYENYLFIVLHFPYKIRKRMEVEELKMFIGPDYFITLHNGELKALEKMFQTVQEKLKERKEIMGSGTGYLLYEVVRALFDSCFPILDDIEDDINEIEKDVFDQEIHQRDMLKDIMQTKRNIITLYRMIVPQRAVVAQLEHKNKKFLPKDLEVYFDDVVDKAEKIYNSLENFKALVQSLQDTNESIISHNTNNIIKTLTIFSVTLLPLTLLSGIYGMNISRLPYANDEMSFLILLGMMAAITIVLLGFFKYKKWL